MINERNIAVSIVLSIFTCGIYYLYWVCMLNDESKYVANEPAAPSGGMVIILTLVTCGIYGIYWNYMMGKRMQRAMQNAGLMSEDRSIVYLLLSIFGFSIISACLIQADLNTISQAQRNIQR